MFVRVGNISGWSSGPLLRRNWPTTKEGNNPTSFAYFSQQKVDVLSLNATTKTIPCFLNIPPWILFFSLRIFYLFFHFISPLLSFFLSICFVSIKHVKYYESRGSLSISVCQVMCVCVSTCVCVSLTCFEKEKRERGNTTKQQKKAASKNYIQL